MNQLISTLIAFILEYARKTDVILKSYFVILYMDKSNGILESEKLFTTLVTLFVPSFCSNPNALGYSIFSDDCTGRWMNTINHPGQLKNSPVYQS